MTKLAFLSLAACLAAFPAAAQIYDPAAAGAQYQADREHVAAKRDAARARALRAHARYDAARGDIGGAMALGQAAAATQYRAGQHAAYARGDARYARRRVMHDYGY